MSSSRDLGDRASAGDAGKDAWPALLLGDCGASSSGSASASDSGVDFRLCLLPLAAAPRWRIERFLRCALIQGWLSMSMTVGRSMASLCSEVVMNWQASSDMLVGKRGVCVAHTGVY